MERSLKSLTSFELCLGQIPGSFGIITAPDPTQLDLSSRTIFMNIIRTLQHQLAELLCFPVAFSRYNRISPISAQHTLQWHQTSRDFREVSSRYNIKRRLIHACSCPELDVKLPHTQCNYYMSNPDIFILIIYHITHPFVLIWHEATRQLILLTETLQIMIVSNYIYWH